LYIRKRRRVMAVKIASERTFNDKSYHWTGDFYSTKLKAQSAAKKEDDKYGAYTRIIKIPKGYVVYSRYRFSFGG